MEQRNRPLGREKHVIEGSAHVGRREGAGPVGGGGKRSGGAGGGGGGGGLLPIIIVALVALLGGGGGLTALLGGGGGDAGLPAQPTAAVTTPAAGQSGGAVDATVAAQARDKRVVLAGDGSDTTTVLVYMCGTDLESNGGYATKDLQEMTAAKLGDKVRLVVFTGGCKGWRNGVVSAGKNQIYQIRDGGLALLWENSALQPMTDPDTLSGFIRWGVENCPADRYELIFWDHGGGSLSGYGYDEVYPKAGSMNLGGIAKALKDGGCTFDFIGFDACLMATLETALVAEPYADYLIASEETEPGCGWYYTGWLNALAAQPSMPALQIGKQIADDFVSVCGQAARNQQATLSVVDLAELAGTVPGAFQDFAVATAQSIRSDNYQAVATARGNTKEFSRSNGLDQVDLIDLADHMATAQSKTLAKVLRSAVKYNATSRNIQNANGLSIYFPYGKTSNVNKATQLYDQIGLDGAYTDCIKSFASLETAGQTVAGGSAGQLESLFGALMGGGSPNTGSFAGQLDPNAVADLMGLLLGGRSATSGVAPQKAQPFLDDDLLSDRDTIDYLAKNQFDASALRWTKKDGKQALVLTEEQWDLVQTAELNVFVDDGEGYIDLGLDNVLEFNDDGDLLGEYDGTWLSVNGQIVAYYLLETQGTAEDYKITGYIPALLNGQRVELMVAFTDEVPRGEVLGAQPVYDEESQTSTVSRGLLDIQEGDVIDFICGYYDYDRNYQDDYYLGQPLTVKGPLTLANIAMDNGQYIAAYRLTDIYHNHYWTPSL